MKPVIVIIVIVERSSLVGLKRPTLRLRCSSAMKFYSKPVSWRLAASETESLYPIPDSSTWFLLFLTEWTGRTSKLFQSKPMSMLKLVFCILFTFKLDGILVYKRGHVDRLSFLWKRNKGPDWWAAVYDTFILQCLVPLKDVIVILSILYQPHWTELIWSYRKNIQVMQ